MPRYSSCASTSRADSKRRPEAGAQLRADARSVRPVQAAKVRQGLRLAARLAVRQQAPSEQQALGRVVLDEVVPSRLHVDLEGLRALEAALVDAEPVPVGSERQQ